MFEPAVRAQGRGHRVLSLLLGDAPLLPGASLGDADLLPAPAFS